LGFDEKVSFPKVTFSRKGFVPAKAIDKLDTIVASDEVKEIVRVLPPKGAALAAPKASPAISAPAVDDAYEEEAPAAPEPAPAPKAAKPKVEQVKGSSELESKLDSLFGE
jgi:hypothetical protein